MASGEGKTRRKQWGGGRLENSGKVCGSCCSSSVVRTAAFLSSLEVPPVHVSCAFLVSSPPLLCNPIQMSLTVLSSLPLFSGFFICCRGRYKVFGMTGPYRGTSSR